MNSMPANYLTYVELSNYARQRAKVSANRRSPQDFEYWVSIANWADRCASLNCDIRKEFESRLLILSGSRQEEYVSDHITFLARIHAEAIHLRTMLINSGEVVQTLSLNWLRQACHEFVDGG